MRLKEYVIINGIKIERWMAEDNGYIPCPHGQMYPLLGGPPIRVKKTSKFIGGACKPCTQKRKRQFAAIQKEREEEREARLRERLLKKAA